MRSYPHRGLIDRDKDSDIMRTIAVETLFIRTRPYQGSSMDSNSGQSLLQSLTREQCLKLLGAARVGRFCANIDDQLTVLPVNFALFENAILIRSFPGTKLNAAVAGLKVAFEVDDFEPDGSAGWSVLVRGNCREVTFGGEVVKALAVPLDTPPFRDRPNRLIRIETTQMTGRRFARPDPRADEGHDQQFHDEVDGRD